MSRLVKFWAVLAAVLPMLLGLAMIAVPTVLGEVGTVEYLGRSAGIRNVVFGLVVALALVTQPNRVLAVLLLLRGVTDLGDGLISIPSGQLNGIVGPIVMALISFAVAAWLYRRPDERLFPRRTVTADPEPATTR